MKRELLICLMAFAWVVVVSAQEDKTVQLQEVKVEAARVVSKADGSLYIPSKAQVEASTNAYSLLNKLNLPYISIDEVVHTIRAIDGRGIVEVRINGAKATKEDLLSLNPRLVKSVDYINTPGIRYGEDVECVIDIKMRRADTGYDVGLDATNSATVWHGNNMVYGKRMRGNSEWALSYDFAYDDKRGARYHETTDYLLQSGQRYTVTRQDIGCQNRSFDNNLQGKYTYADTLGNVFQATFSTSFSHQSNADSRRMFIDGSSQTEVSLNSHSTKMSPVLDLYLFHRIGSHQNITANVVGTSISTDDYNYQDEGSPYAYTTDGNTWSLLSEAIYENQLKPLMFSVGARHTWKYTRNRYQGDVSALNGMHNSSLYLFSEVSGQWRRLDYVAGIGLANQHYRQGEHTYDYWLVRPKFTIGYNLLQGLQVRYTFETHEHVSKIAMVNDTRVRINSMEWMVGNPDIKPNRVIINLLSLNYTRPLLLVKLSGEYRINNHPNMTKYIREGDEFLYTQTNQPHINMIDTDLFAQYELVKDHLTLFSDLFYCRFFNKGDDYNHIMNSWNYVGGLQAYLGKWTLQAQLDTGWKFMEGENWNDQGLSTVLEASYRLGSWTFGLYWQQPFQAHPTSFKDGVKNRYVHKSIQMRNSDEGNLVSINVSFNLSKGQKARQVNRHINNRDTDAGLL